MIVTELTIILIVTELEVDLNPRGDSTNHCTTLPVQVNICSKLIGMKGFLGYGWTKKWYFPASIKYQTFSYKNVLKMYLIMYFWLAIAQLEHKLLHDLHAKLLWF